MGSCWPLRRQPDMRKHKVAEGQMSDLGPLHFPSTVSSTTEVAVLLRDSRGDVVVVKRGN